MAEREYFTEIQRRIAAPPALVWAIVSDTNRWDRAAGLVPGHYSFEGLPSSDEESRARVGRVRQFGIDIRWYEPPYEWIEGRYLWGERRFLSGPVSRGGLNVELAPADDGRATDVHARAWVAGEGIGAALVGTVMRGRFRAALARYLDAVASVLTRNASIADHGWSLEPPASLVRRLLASGTTDEVTSGKITPVNEADFAHRARRYESAPLSPELRARVVAMLRERPDEELGQIRPFELARIWGMDRREVLRAFLHAARAGLVDLRWQLNCPTCRVASEVSTSLTALRPQAHCDSCNIAFDLDFGAHVEAVFSVSPAVRKVETALYCASSPWFRPHVFAQLRVEPGSRRDASAPLPPGPLAFRTLSGRRHATLDVGDEPPAALTVHLYDEKLAIEASGRTRCGHESAITIVNETPTAVVLSIERAGWNADIVLGTAIATMPDFLDLFATEAPATGVELRVGTMTMLFSDLTGSTALYERVGDARAFALVQEHFRDMNAAITRHGGAIVKTMGDAVMAAFESPVSAVRAALEMVREAERAHAAEGLSVKLGLHEGPCLVVRANDRLDFFGTTVNIAARLQAQAQGSQVVVMEDLLAHPEVAEALRGYPASRFEAHLKGIREVQHLVAIDAGELAGAERSALRSATSG